MFFGYWILSNRQLISNDFLPERQYQSDPSRSEHTISDLFKSESWNNPGWPLFVLGWIYILMSALNGPINKLLNWIFPSTKVDLDPNEDIEMYWEALSTKDLIWTYKEEEQFRNTFKEKFDQTA